MKNQKIVYITLALSILLNAFLLGFVVAHGHMRGPHGGPGFPGGPEAMLEQLAEKLPPDHRDQVKKLLHAQSEKMHTAFMDMRVMIDEVQPILTAEKFDEGKLRALSDKIDAHDRQIKQGIAETLINIAKTLPDAERIEFFNHLPPLGPPPPPEFDR